MRADLHPRTVQEQWSARRGIHQLFVTFLAQRSPPSYRFAPRNIGVQVHNFKLTASNFRLLWPTLYLRERIEEASNLVRRRVGPQGAQTILIYSLVVTHRAICFSSLRIVESPRLTVHVLWPSSQRTQGNCPRPSNDCQPSVRVNRRPTHFCTSSILS